MAYYSAAERMYWYMNNLDEYTKNYDREKNPNKKNMISFIWHFRKGKSTGTEIIWMTGKDWEMGRLQGTENKLC